MEKYISDLTKKWKEAGDNVRDLYAVQIDAAKKKLAEMTGSASPTGSIADLTARMNELKKEQNLATGTEGWKNMQREINALAIQIKELKGEMGGVSITEGITESISSRQLELKTGKLDTSTVDKKIKELKDGGDDIRKSWQTAGNAISQLGAAMQSIEDPAMKVFSIVAQAVATVALSFSKALGEDKTTKGNIWAFIGAAAASTAAMITMISQIHSATGFARGGIVDGTSGGFVGGTSFSGDNIGNVRLDAGELVLNKSQQNNLANALQSSYAQSETQKPYVTGEMIYIALTNYMRRSGQGETLKFR